MTVPKAQLARKEGGDSHQKRRWQLAEHDNLVAGTGARARHCLDPENIFCCFGLSGLNEVTSVK